MDATPHAPTGETPRTLPALIDGLERHLSTKGDQDITTIQAYVRGIERFTDVTSSAPQHEGDAAMTSVNACRALADARLARLGVLTSKSSPAWEAAGR